MLLPSGLPGALVAAEVLEVAAVVLVAFFMLGSRFLIHLQRNLNEGKWPMSNLSKYAHSNGPTKNAELVNTEWKFRISYPTPSENTKQHLKNMFLNRMPCSAK